MNEKRKKLETKSPLAEIVEQYSARVEAFFLRNHQGSHITQSKGMKKVEISETKVQDVLNHIEKNMVTRRVQPPFIRVQHFLIEDGVVIPWDIAQNPLAKKAWVQAELKKEELKLKELEEALMMKELHKELDKLKPSTSDILWVAGLLLTIALVFLL